MNWIIFFFGSGAAFYSGVGLVIGAAVFLSVCERKGLVRLAVVSAFLGLLLIYLSAAPLPYWLYGVGGLISFVWLWAERSAWARLQKWRRLLRISTVLCWSIATILEVPHVFVPTVGTVGSPRLYIFADSVTAGMGDKTVTWPALLARTQGIEIKDFSQAGATVSSMAKVAEGLALGDGVVLLEIGGNDVLGFTSAKDYERGLDKLLAILSVTNRNILMFELPLPPFYNEFGRVQRRLAEKYRVQMIPKRIFIDVLTADGATVDSVHLSHLGHELMAATVWKLIQPAFAQSAKNTK
jgi:acyl-CoA thioesterase I